MKANDLVTLRPSFLFVAVKFVVIKQVLLVTCRWKNHECSKVWKTCKGNLWRFDVASL